MTWRGRLATYVAIFGAAWWMASGHGPASTLAAAPSDHARALPKQSVSDRQGVAPLPALPVTEVEPVAAPEIQVGPREPVSRTTPVREDFVQIAGLTESQRVRFEVETGLWSDAIGRLARDAVANRRPTALVSQRAREIQTAYESALKSFLSVDQLAVYGDFRSRGEMGTYAIELPVEEE